MGWGDEIMVTGQARAVQRHHPRPVAVKGRDGKLRWHSLWSGSRRIVRPSDVTGGSDIQFIRNGPGCRPYVDTAAMRTEFEHVFPGRPFTTKLRHARLPWRYTGWRATPGELPCVRSTRRLDYIIVEPHVKIAASPNKDWGWVRWQALVRLRPDLDWVQLGPRGTRLLTGVRHIHTEDFLAACTWLGGACAAVLPEGGLHHAAAALGIPAVVIFGGMTSPANTGYDAHVNLFAAGPGSPCGMRVACDHCARAMAGITPETVAERLEQLL